MPLKFGSVNADCVNCGTGAGTANLTQTTIAGWTEINNPVDGQTLYQRGLAGSGAQLVGWTDPGSGLNLHISGRRATTSAEASAVVANVTGYGTTKRLLFIAGQLDLATSGNNRLWTGTLGTHPTEPSAYSIQTNGSGTQGDNSAQAMFIGNKSNFNSGWGDLIFWVGVWSRLLSYDQIAQLWGLRYNYVADPIVRSAAAFWRPGVNGAGLVLDESGYGNHGTITGAVPTRESTLPRGPFSGLVRQTRFPWQNPNMRYSRFGDDIYPEPR